MRFLYVLILIVITQVAQAQPAINSLEELLDYADKNSPAARQALLQPELARHDKQTQASVLYPRVNAFATGDYYPILATQLIPAEALGGAPGTYLKAQFGLPYVFTTGAELTVPVVNLENWAKLAKAKAQYEQSDFYDITKGCSRYF
jgi:outer membrane protein TolC